MGKPSKKESKYNKALEGLNFVAREFGDESDNVLELEKLGVDITKESAPEYRANMKAVWVDVPYREEIENDMKKSMVADLYRDLAKVHTDKNGNKMIKYPVNFEISEINSEINYDLCETFQVCDKDLTDSQWEELQNTEQWKKAEIQVMREMTANHLSDKYGELLEKNEDED